MLRRIYWYVRSYRCFEAAYSILLQSPAVLLQDADDKPNTILRSVGGCLPADTAWHRTRPDCSAAPL